MTEPVVGKNLKNIHSDLANYKLSVERKFAAAMDDLIDGDNNTTRAQQILNELRTLNVEEFALHEKIARGDVKGAEMDALRLSSGVNGVQKP